MIRNKEFLLYVLSGHAKQQNFSDKEGDCFELEANDEFLQHDIQELVKEVMKLRDSL